MVYEGMSRIGGVEWVNFERLAAYAANGLVSPDVRLPILRESCTGLAEVLGDATVYRTPMQDAPPWLDYDEPDSYDFAGVLPLTITGLDDTTRTVELVPLLGDGALAQRAVRGSRTIGVTAMLLGRTTEGVLAGKAWLTRLLQNECSDDDECPAGARLELLTTCPGPILPTANTDAPPVSSVQVHPNDAAGVPESWTVSGGQFIEPAPKGGNPYDATVLQVYGSTDAIDAGEGATLVYPDVIQAGDATDQGAYFIDGGAARIRGQAFLAGLPRTCTDGPVTMTWQLREHPGVGGAQVTLAILGDDGLPEFTGPTVTLTPELHAYSWEVPFGVYSEHWRPALIANDSIEVKQLIVVTYPDTDPYDCVAPYLRTLPGAVCTSGPTVVDVLDAGCAELLTVEWVWQIGTPYAYGPTTTLLVGLASDIEPSLVAPGVTYRRLLTASTAAAVPAQYCPTPPVALANCAVDPLAPGFGTAPALPRITSATAVNLAANSVVRSYDVTVGPEQTPANDGIFTIELTALLKPAVGVRVRVWDDVAADGTNPEPCAFAYEYHVDFIPAGGTLTLGGPDELVATLCDGESRYADASAVVRGSYQGPTVQPSARCNRRYRVRVDQLDTYPRTSPGIYTSGQEQGLLSLDLHVTPREG